MLSSSKIGKAKILACAILASSLMLISSDGTTFARELNNFYSSNQVLAQRQRFGDQQTTGDGGGSMSSRFKKYMDNDEGGVPSDRAGMRNRFRQRFQGMSPEDRQKIRQRLQGMSPDERRNFMLQMRAQRGQQGQRGGINGALGRGGDLGRGGMGQDGMRPDGMRRGGPQAGGARGKRGVKNYRRRGGGRRGQQGRGMAGGRSWFNRKPIDFSVLNLSEKQKTRIKGFRQVNAQKARSVNRELRVQRSRMKHMMFDPSANRQQIMQQRDQVRKLQNQAEDIMLNDFLSIRNVLTEEQMQKLPEIAPGRRRSARKAPPKPAPAIGADSKASGL